MIVFGPGPGLEQGTVGNFANQHPTRPLSEKGLHGIETCQL